MNAARAVAEQWWTASDVVQAFPDAGAVRQFLTWLQQFSLGRKRLAMFAEVALRLPSVTKTKRNWSPGSSPAGAWRMMPASAWPPNPDPNQSTAATIAKRRGCGPIRRVFCVCFQGAHIAGARRLCCQHPAPTRDAIPARINVEGSGTLAAGVKSISSAGLKAGFASSLV
jgi:hypothetical protein